MYTTLPSWDNIPMTHFGTWKLERPFVAVKNALEKGYKCIDCASDYGNEKEVGKAITEYLSSGNDRSDLFITSKLWNTYHDNVEEACRKSLMDLNLSYLDMYLIHFPISLKRIEIDEKYPAGWEYEDQGMKIDRVPMHKVWKQMEKLVKDNLVRNIGVCNFPVALLSDLLSYCNILPAVLQVEIHPENSQEALVKFCKNNNIHVCAFSPFGGISYKKETILDNKDVCSIAKKYNCSSSQVILSWNRNRGISVIPRSENENNLISNLMHVDLDIEDMNILNELNVNKRYNDPKEFTPIFGGFEPIYD